MKVKHLHFSMSIESTVPVKLIGDVVRLRQVLANFMSNGIKFSPEDGHIELKARFISLDTTDGAQTVAHIELSVRDSGPGISPADQRKLFQAFSQLHDNEQQLGRGSGLGLCICKHLVHLMGGSIGIRSRLHWGTVFFIVMPLPIQPGAEQVFAASSTNIHEVTPSRSPRTAPCKPSYRQEVMSADETLLVEEGSIRVLVVDDVASNRKLIQRCIQHLGFNDVTTAINGREAVEICNQRKFDLILMDNVSSIVFEISKYTRATLDSIKTKSGNA